MSLHADVAVPARDRRRLERLCRYVARPPLAAERLEECSDGTLALRLKTRWRDGTTHVLMERRELVERLVPLIPPPRAHQVRYHGILAPSASLRDAVVPAQLELPPARLELPAGETPAQHLGRGGRGTVLDSEAGTLPPQPDRERLDMDGNLEAPVAPRVREADPRGDDGSADAREHAARMRWAALLQRVFEIDALRCPRCGSTMRLIAAIEDPDIARRILDCLNLPARAPPLHEATAAAEEPEWPEDDWLFDQSPTRDEA